MSDELKQFDTQVLIVSGQAAQNLRPVTDFGLKANKFVLVVTEEMKENAESLKESLRLAVPGAAFTMEHLPDPADMTAMSNWFLELFAKLQSEGRSVLVNITGGTKLMSFAALQTAEAFDVERFYLDINTGKITILGTETSLEALKQKRHSLRCEFLSRGFEIREKTTLPLSRERAEFAADLVKTEPFRKAYGVVNYLASKAEATLKVDYSPQSKEVEAIVDRLERLGIVSVRGGKLRFANEEARFFVNGGWLESWCGSEIRKTFPNTEVLQNVEIEYVQGHYGKTNIKGANNELDVVFKHDDTLCLIECKTCSFEDGDKGKAVLDKLGVLSQRLGLRVMPVLLSYHKLLPHVRQRAADQGILVVAGSDVKRLREMLKARFKKQVSE